MTEPLFPGSEGESQDPHALAEVIAEQLNLGSLRERIPWDRAARHRPGGAGPAPCCDRVTEPGLGSVLGSTFVSLERIGQGPRNATEAVVFPRDLPVEIATSDYPKPPDFLLSSHWVKTPSFELNRSADTLQGMPCFRHAVDSSVTRRRLSLRA